MPQMVKNLACNAGDPGSIAGWERFPGGGHGNALQYPCLENLMDRGAWSMGLQRVGHNLAAKPLQISGREEPRKVLRWQRTLVEVLAYSNQRLHLASDSSIS